MVNSHTPAFMANILNIVLATGIFTLPFSLWETGFFLGGIILLIVALVSFTTNTFLIETIAIANAIEKEEQEIFNISIYKLKASTDNDSTRTQVSVILEQGNIETMFKFENEKSKTEENTNNKEDLYSIKSKSSVSFYSSNDEKSKNLINDEIRNE